MNIYNRNTKKYLKLQSEEIEYKFNQDVVLLDLEEQINISKVKENGLELGKIIDQTEEICKLAVQQTPYALDYVKNQTEELCKLAVQQFVKWLGITIC